MSVLTKWPRNFANEWRLNDEPTEEKQINRRTVSWFESQLPGVHYEMDLDRIAKPPAHIPKGSPAYIGWCKKVEENNRIYGHKPKRPDCKLFYPNLGYCGLAMEFKTVKKNPTTKRGGPFRVKSSAKDHLLRQAYILGRMNKYGYFATFTVGWEHTRKLCEWYKSGAHKESMKIEQLELYDPRSGLLKIPIVTFF